MSYYLNTNIIKPLAVFASSSSHTSFFPPTNGSGISQSTPPIIRKCAQAGNSGIMQAARQSGSRLLSSCSVQKLSTSLLPTPLRQQQSTKAALNNYVDPFPPTPFPEAVSHSATQASSSNASSAIPATHNYSPFMFSNGDISSRDATKVSSSSASSAIPATHNYSPSFIMPPSETMSNAATEAGSSSAHDLIIMGRDYNPTPSKSSEKSNKRTPPELTQSSDPVKRTKRTDSSSTAVEEQALRKAEKSQWAKNRRKKLSQIIESLADPDSGDISHTDILSRVVIERTKDKQELERLRQENETLKLCLQLMKKELDKFEKKTKE